MNVAIIAAVPLELKHLVRGWERVPISGRWTKAWRRTDGAGDTVIAGCAGMGAEAARRAFVEAEAHGRVDLVLSVGLAGATDAALSVGGCYAASEIVDAQTGERFCLAEGTRRLRIATLPHVADAAEKRRVRETYGAAMVDMESSTIARMAEQRGIPICCIKAVSDRAEAILPDIAPYLREGQLRMAPFLAGVLLKPRYWASLIHLGRNSAVAARALAGSVEQVLIHKDWARVNSTGSFEGVDE